MTHEYVIATGGVISGVSADVDGRPATAIAWAADRILAVGTDARVRAISRGDSTVIDLDGCRVAVLDGDEPLEPGALADLAFWRSEQGPDGGSTPIAVVRAGAFTEGDPHQGPFRRISSDP